MIALALRTVEFLFYHLLLSVVDRVSRLPRDTIVPEAMRLYRENIALKAQLDALERHLVMMEPRPMRAGIGLRAAQVFAYLLSRGDEPFQRYFLSAPLTTVMRWATRFRSLKRRPPLGGRPPLDAKIVELIVTLKRENPPWGQRRIREELRRMGIRVREPTIARILLEHGFSPRPLKKLDFDRVRAATKDALWALDFFAVKTAKGVWLQALLVIDIHTRELLDIRVYDGWDVDSIWTIRALGEIVARTKRQPVAVVHDHGPQFLGQFKRQLRVLEVDEDPSHVEDFLMTWGTEARAAGATHITLVRRDLPIELQDTEVAARAEGWIIVAGDDGSLVTCYRRVDAWRFVRRKSQMRPRKRSRRT